MAMAMALLSSALLSLLLLSYAIAAAPTEEEQPVFFNTTLAETVHDILPEYGLPKGLLPSSVRSYSLSEDGTFEVELEAPCYVQFTYLVYYGTQIRGRLSYGAATDLSGIQAKKFFLWVPVTGMVMDNPGMIVFQSGFISEKLPAKQFEAIPTCRNKVVVEEDREGGASSRSYPCRGFGFFPQTIVSEE